MNYELTTAVLQALAEEKVEYIVFGGVALNLLGLARTTDDLDLFLPEDRDNIERLKVALRRVFDDPCVEEISADELVSDYPAVQYNPPSGDFHIDILTRLGEAFRYVDLEAQAIQVGRVSVQVATPRTLVRMKRDTVRPKDWGDVAALKARFDIDEGL